MTLRQQVVKEARFSKSRKPSENIQQTVSKKYRTRGGLSGKVILADDFNETPECFKEYM